MKKIVIASHGTMAAGIKNTLELISGSQPSITALCFYTDDQAIDHKVDALFNNLKPEDQLIICTDIAFGSVNQLFMKKSAALNKKNVLLISGMNLPLLLGIATTPGKLTPMQIDSMIDQAQSSLSRVDWNELKKTSQSKVEDEAEFFN